MLGLLTIARIDCESVCGSVDYALDTGSSLFCTKVTVKGCSFSRNKSRDKFRKKE